MGSASTRDGGPADDAPHVRGTIVGGAVAGVSLLWGDAGIRDVSERLDAAARGAICDRIVHPLAWYPEASFRAWCEAVWDGPARRDDRALTAFIHRSVDHGWGWVHRALLRLATPGLLARRAPSIWKHDHTHGQLTVALDDRRATVRIEGYPHPRSSIMRRGQAESLRYILTRSRFSDVRGSHTVDGDGTYVLTLRWG